ncbi:non-ribosomal peptide synthetase [Pseudomonas sp. MWU16-30317]|uniref:non-ribosomal peptide synthetase n=1 Tax=Pseudomonas sp. MWU16-30317 TaxID=2878095 RepID=UPI001CF98ECF|nr:non-ribosomal peptide synthetase [Pseudomonas sp. MWU16-30317]
MNAELSLKLARRFIELPTEKRRLFLEGLQQEGVDFALLPIPADVASAERDGLSYAQQRMWFLWQLDPHSAAYNLPMAVRLKGALDVAALHSAFNLLVARHETLRTLFHEHDEQIRQHVLDSLAVGIQRHDLSALQPDDREAQVTLIAETEACAPFDLVQGPLLRVQLLTLAADEHVLLLTLHHIVADGWSLNVLIEEFLRCYDAACSGTEAALTVLPIQYRDYALWQRSWLEAGEQERQLAYWRDKLGEDHTPLELPNDHARPSQPSYRGAHHRCPIDAALAEQLRALAKAQGVTLFMVLLAAFKVLLFRYSGQTTIRVGVPVANRNRGEVEGLIGCFINTQVLHTEIDPLHDVHALLSRIKDTALEAQAHQELPFERLVEALALDRSSPSPLFQVLFNHQAAIADAGQIRTQSGLSVEKLALDKHSARFDLALDTYESAGQLHAVFTYALDVFEGQTVTDMSEHWLQVLEALVAVPHRRIGELTVRVAQPATDDTPIAREVTSIHGLIERACEQHPQQIAAVSAGETITYAVLQQRSDALARVLLDNGAQPDQRIGVLADRSINMLVAIVAVLKAGAAYLPLEPDQPAQRLAFMLADSQVKRVLGRDIELPDDVRLIAFDAPWPAVTLQPVPVHAEHLAYVIYTSGTTGMPKGVAVSHGALVNYVLSVGERVPLATVRSLAMVTTPAADLGHTMFYGALCAGKTLHLLDKQTVLDADVFAAYMREHAIDALKIVPSHLQAMLSAGAAALPRRVLIVGGEAVAPALLSRITALAPVLRVFNHYGPTETTVGVLTHELAGEPVLGRALDNIRAQVLSDCLQAVPGAAKGELYIGGAGLARGYLGKPALTAERFVPDPANAHGARMYRTGDWVRAQRDGALRFIGRIDGQVKIRGYRVELAEIESRVCTLAGVANAVVRVVGEGENRQLAAYLVLAHWTPDAAAQQLFVEDVGRALKALLPDHLQPQHWLALERLPITANGKLDGKALPEPVAAATLYRAPVTELQVQVAAIWAEVLQVSRVGLEDNFFALGGHSLLATQVVSRVRRQSGVEVALRVLFDTQNLGQFVSELAARTPQRVSAIAVVNREAPLPVSHAQHRQWMFWKLHPTSTAYHTPLVVRLTGQLDIDALQATLSGLVSRHETLRTVFVEDDGTPRQQVLPTMPVVLTQRDAAGLDEAQLATRIEAAVAQPFDLAHGPLWRALLLRQGNARHVLVLSLHHVVSDGWSMGVMVRECLHSYRALTSGAPADLPVPIVQYADYAVWQRQQLEQGVLHTQLVYWRATLENDFTPLELPADRPRPAVQSHRGARIDMDLPVDLVERLRALAVKRNATLFHVLLSAFALVLARYGAREKINIGVPMTNRNRVELEGLLGFFVNTVVVRLEVDPAQPFEAYLDRVKEVSLQAQDHKEVPFDTLVEALNPDRSTAYNPLFQVMYNHLRDVGTQVAQGSVAGLHLEEIELVEHSAQFDLALNTLELRDGVRASFTFATDLFDQTRIERMSQHWLTVLRAMAEAPTQAVGELAIIGAAEQRAQIEAGTGPRVEVPGLAVHQWFERQAVLEPHALALVYNEQEWTREALNSRANALAHALAGLGVGRGSRVAIAMQRTPDTVAALFAVLKSGAAYVPLDLAYPLPRLRYMLQDSEATVLMVQGDGAAALPTLGDITVLDVDEVPAHPSGPGNLDLGCVAADLAYCIYTSGSTGTPKGVMIEHGNVAALVQWSASVYSRDDLQGVLAATSICFDLSAWELFVTLGLGGSVILANNALQLPELPARDRVRLINTVPSVIRTLCDTGQIPASVRIINTAGEALKQTVVDALYAQTQVCRVYDLYGPSEDTTYSTFSLRTPAGHDTIGRPLSNSAAYLLDDGVQCVPAGHTAEIFMAGSGLARGYLNRPALTAQRFVPDPLAAVAGQRMYRTADLARQDAEGSLVCLGRTDHQVKIRGFRVECGEIEVALRRLPGIQDAVVVDVEAAGSRQLVAYLVLAAPQSDSAPNTSRVLKQRLDAHLRQSLPDYMVPAYNVVLAALPLTANGKLDRAALPAPQHAEPGRPRRLPETPLQQQVAAVWAQALNLPEVGLDDNFFELGGHSLLATQVTARLQAQQRIDLPLLELFQAPDLQRYAQAIERYQAGSSADLDELGDWLGELEVASHEEPL